MKVLLFIGGYILIGIIVNLIIFLWLAYDLEKTRKDKVSLKFIIFDNFKDLFTGLTTEYVISYILDIVFWPFVIFEIHYFLHKG